MKVDWTSDERFELTFDSNGWSNVMRSPTCRDSHLKFWGKEDKPWMSSIFTRSVRIAISSSSGHVSSWVGLGRRLIRQETANNIQARWGKNLTPLECRLLATAGMCIATRCMAHLPAVEIYFCKLLEHVSRNCIKVYNRNALRQRCLRHPEILTGCTSEIVNDAIIRLGLQDCVELISYKDECGKEHLSLFPRSDDALLRKIYTENQEGRMFSDKFAPDGSGYVEFCHHIKRVKQRKVIRVGSANPLHADTDKTNHVSRYIRQNPHDLYRPAISFNDALTHVQKVYLDKSNDKLRPIGYYIADNLGDIYDRTGVPSDYANHIDYSNQKGAGRIFGNQASLQFMPTKVRNALYPSWVDFDLSNLHYAICARALGMSIDPERSIWSEINESIIATLALKNDGSTSANFWKSAIGSVKKHTKAAFYSLLFSKRLKRVVRSIFDSVGNDSDFESQFLADLHPTARTELIRDFAAAFGACPVIKNFSARMEKLIYSKTVNGVTIPLDRNARRLEATKFSNWCQAIETKIVTRLYLAAWSRQRRDVAIVIHGHDGVTVASRDATELRKFYRECCYAICEEILPTGICTSLAIKGDHDFDSRGIWKQCHAYALAEHIEELRCADAEEDISDLDDDLREAILTNRPEIIEKRRRAADLSARIAANAARRCVAEVRRRNFFLKIKQRWCRPGAKNKCASGKPNIPIFDDLLPVRGDCFIVNRQKLWTIYSHPARGPPVNC